MAAKKEVERANTFSLCGWTIYQFDCDQYILPIVEEIDATFKDITYVKAGGGFFHATYLHFKTQRYGPDVCITAPLISPHMHYLFTGEEYKYEIKISHGSFTYYGKRTISEMDNFVNKVIKAH